MKRRIRLGAAVLSSVAMLLAVVGCGDDAEPTTATPAPETSPTASASLEPLCFATEAYALEHIVAVIGQDKVPTAFDAVNQGGCEFQFPAGLHVPNCELSAGRFGYRGSIDAGRAALGLPSPPQLRRFA